jgi:hypothetical protein
MRNHLARFAVPVLTLGALGALGACGNSGTGTGGTSSTGTTQGTGGGTGGAGTGGAGSTTSTTSTTSTSSTGGGTPGQKGWTAVPLIDDTTDPANTVFRAGNDLVTGIHFASLDDGWVATQGSDQTFSNGGAVFKAKQKTVTKVLFGGNRDGLCLLGTIDFHGIEKTPDGLVALSYACDVIASHDGGATFGIEPAASGDKFGIEEVLVMRRGASGTVMVGETGYVSTTPGAAGPTALWTDTWAPEAIPSIPNPVPADQCQGGPHSVVPAHSTSAYASPDGKLLAYVAAPNFDAQICVSTDGGKSFFPKVLPGVPSDAQGIAPTGVTFATAQIGVTWWALSIYPGLQYIYRTADGGQTWAPVALPAGAASQAIELASAFFAPDGTHGWMVGYDHDASSPILLRTKDSGASWELVASDLAQKVAAAGGDKLFTGFALDATHIWIGGPRGLFLANEAGGD